MNEAVLMLVERYWDDLLETEPILGTMTGDERFDDRLPDPSESGRSLRTALHRDALDAVAELDRDSLDEVERTTVDVMEAVARRYLGELEHRTDRLVAANHLYGPTQLLGDLAGLQRADTAERLERYEARLRAVPAHLDAWIEVARDGIAAGVTVPRIVAERSIAQLESTLALPLGESPALMPAGDDPAARGRIEAIVRDAVNPAYERFLGEMRDYLPHATGTLGLSSLPDGEAMYAAEIVAWTTLELDPEAVHALGWERFEAIDDERRQVAASLGYDSPDAAIEARRASGENTAESPEAMVALVEDQVARSWEGAAPWFGRLPSANCGVRAVESFREANVPAAFYQPPTEDGSRPGIYYINTYDLPSRDLHSLASVTFHEANPGHHFQIALEQEFGDRPRLRRFGGGLAGSSFSEGWGLYSERLADEMDLYLDGWERLGMLENQAFRAARLITDTGLHALGWDREPAVQLLMRSGAQRTDAEIEVDRYVAMPAQALSYMIGMIEIEKARSAAAARAGADFDLRAFHDRLLMLGTIPLPSLMRELG